MDDMASFYPLPAGLGLGPPHYASSYHHQPAAAPPPPPPPPPGAAQLPYHSLYVPPQQPTYANYAPHLVTHSTHDDLRTLFIAGLPEDVKAREIYNLCREFPGYESSQLRQSSQPYAFAVFWDQQSAISAMHELNGMVFDIERGSTLYIDFAKANSRSKRSRLEDEWPGSDKKLRGSLSRGASHSSSGSTHRPGMSNPTYNTIGYPSTQSHANGDARAAKETTNKSDQSSGKTIGSARMINDLYYFEDKLSRNKIAEGLSSISSLTVHDQIMVWHYRLGHPNFSYLKHLFPALFQKLDTSSFQCESCLLAKSQRKSYNKRPYHPSKPFYLFHSDVWGPSKYETQSAAPCPTIFVANLGPTCTEEELVQVFSRFSGFLKLKMQSTYGAPVAFVDFQDTSCSTSALNNLQGMVLYSSQGGEGMRLEYAKSRMGMRRKQ